MSPGLTCHNCGSSEFETDQARGDTVCMKCGIVIEDNVIVNEIQFEEGSFGGTHVVGQRVNDDYGGSRITVGGLIGCGSGKQSRQITLDNAKKKIKTVANLLNLNSVCIDQAFGFYKMALNRRLTHGRKNSHVIAACVYMVCRLELTPHILLDLSDIMSVNVYSLGQTYLRLTSALSIKIPPIDPCIYIMRYAYKLSVSINCFKEKSNEIQMTALRLVSRMKRDWMHAGRRPSGLCGAALLVSARLHGLHCSIKDVIKVVKVCETTIRKRLNEFGDTPSSKLTLEEFLSIDLEGEEDPPCYKTARRKHKEECTQEKQDSELELKEELSREIGELQIKIDKALEKSRKKLKGPYAKYAKVVDAVVADKGADLRNDEERLTMEIIESTTVETIKTVLTGGGGDEQQLKGDNNLFDSIDELRPTAESLGLGSKNDSPDLNQPEESHANDAESNNGTLYHDDISDSEIDSYLLSPSEIQSKTAYWVKYHADYLKEMEEKELKKRQDEELRKEREAKGEVTPKKKRKTRKRSQTVEAGSAGEAVERMLMDKFPKLSSKINYDILKKLERTDPGEELDALEAQQTKEASELTRLDTYENRSYLRGNSSLKRLPRLNSTAFGSDNNHVNKLKPSQAQSLKSKFSSLISSRQNATSTASNKTSGANGQSTASKTAAAAAARKEDLAPSNLDEESDELESEDEYSASKEQTLSLAGLMSAEVDDYEMDYDELDY